MYTPTSPSPVSWHTLPADTRNACHSAEKLLHSTWGKMAADPQLRAQLPQLLLALIKRLGKLHPVTRYASMALEVFTTIRTSPRKSPRDLLILSAALLYTISPVDAMLDSIPLAGWVDDIAILSLAFSCLRQGFSQKRQAGSPRQHS